MSDNFRYMHTTNPHAELFMREVQAELDQDMPPRPGCGWVILLAMLSGLLIFAGIWKVFELIF